MYIIRTVAVICGLLISFAVNAGYDSNMVGVVTDVLTYPDGRVLFKLQNQPTSHPYCDYEYFAIGSDVTAAYADRMYSRLLLSYSTGKPVNIGCDGTTSDCANGYIRTWRVG